jgi:hypothetical protein
MSKSDLPDLDRRRRRKRGLVRLGERLLFLLLIAGVGAAAYWWPRQAPVVQAAEKEKEAANANKFLEEFQAAADREREENRRREARLEAEIEALKNKPAPVDEEGKRRHEVELAAAKKEADELRARNKKLEESKQNVENAVATNYGPPPGQGGPSGSKTDSPKVDPDVPTPGKPTPGGTTPGGQPGNPNARGGNQGGGLGGAAAVAAALLAAKCPALIPVLLALGLDLGGSLFGNDYKQGDKVIKQVQKMFEEGAELKVEAALNRIAAETWGDPTDAIAKLRLALKHPEMRKRLTEAKANEMLARLEEMEKVYEAHGEILKIAGREATMRLLKELPPILLATGGDSAARQHFAALLAPFPGANVQPELWKKEVLGGYINAALNGSALQLTSGGLRPLRITRTPHIDSLLKLLTGKQAGGGGGEHEGT